MNYGWWKWAIAGTLGGVAWAFYLAWVNGRISTLGALRKRVQKHPDDPDVRMDLASCLTKKGRGEEALREYHDLLALLKRADDAGIGPEDAAVLVAQVWSEIADIHWSRGEEQEARSAWQKVAASSSEGFAGSARKHLAAFSNPETSIRRAELVQLENDRSVSRLTIRDLDAARRSFQKSVEAVKRGEILGVALLEHYPVPRETQALRVFPMVYRPLREELTRLAYEGAADGEALS